MKKIFIEKSLFNLLLPASKNLLSGLILLSKRGFGIYSDADFLTGESIITKLLALEQIEIKQHVEDFNYDFAVIHNKVGNIDAAKEFYINSEISFGSAVNLILESLRFAEVIRKTKETDIRISVKLDGKGISQINTGIGFFDHMLDQIARHANIDLSVFVNGDLEIDKHHTVEDTGIALGEAILKAIGDKKGIKRFGFCLPMDDSISLTSVDLSNRPYLNFKVKFKREKVGEFPTELVEEFFRALSVSMKANLFIKAKGKNDHHKIESIFKSFAKALNEAFRFDERAPFELPSTKGIL